MAVTKTDAVLLCVMSTPGCTAKDISIAIEWSERCVYATLHYLAGRREVKRGEKIGQWRTWWPA